jgi:hypothetical protein
MASLYMHPDHTEAEKHFSLADVAPTRKKGSVKLLIFTNWRIRKQCR